MNNSEYKNKATQAEEERKRRYREDCRIIQEGISDEAVEVLRRRFGMDFPVFQLKERGESLTGDTHSLILQAALRDGNHEVILTIERMKRAKL